MKENEKCIKLDDLGG